MSFATNEMVSQWDGFPVRTVHARSLAAGQRVLKGTLGIMVGGEVYRASTFATTPLSAAILTIPGSDSDGGVRLYATQANVRYIQVTGGANLKLGVSVVYTASTVDINLQLATDAGANSTSLAYDVVSAISAHAVASKFIKAGYTGNGTGTALALGAYAALKQVALLGVAEDTYDNLAGVSVATVDMRFTKGIVTLAGLATDLPGPTMIDTQVAIVDDITVRATVNPLDLCVRLADVEIDGSLRCELL